MFCKKCGKQIPDDSNACQYCGAMLTQRPVNDTYNQVNANYQPQPKQKKTPWKIIVPIVAVVVVLAIVISVVSCNNIKKNEDRKRLLEVLEASTDKPVVEFIHEDFDSDGTTEAYAVVGESEKKEDYTEYYDADIYFVNQAEAEIIKESVSGHANGTIEVDDTIYVSLEVYDEGTDKGVSFIYTAEENKPVEPDISGKYSDVHQDGGKILATDEDGNEIEVEITDGEIEEPAEKFLEPTEEDWKKLDEFLDYTQYSSFSYDEQYDENFDAESSDAVKRAYAFTGGYGGYSEVYKFIFDEDGIIKNESTQYLENGEWLHQKKDPLEKFSSCCAYYAYPAERIDWIVKNVFNVTPDRTSFSEGRITDCYSDYYYYGDYFYTGVLDGLGGLGYNFRTENKTALGDGKYKAEVIGYFGFSDSPEASMKITTTVALKEVDGKRIWSFYTYEQEYFN